jgi:hypothetical protein
MGLVRIKPRKNVKDHMGGVLPETEFDVFATRYEEKRAS